MELFCRLSSPLTIAQSGPYARAYPLPAYAVNSYSMQSPGGWFNLAPGQYIVQPQMTAVSNFMLILIILLLVVVVVLDVVVVTTVHQ